MLTNFFSHPFFSSKRGEQAGAALILLLSLLILLPITQTYLLIRNNRRQINAPAVPISFASIQNIPEWHLFGQATDEKNIPLTTLNLQLLGVFYQPGHDSAVIISDAGQPGKLYKVGDGIPEGASLVKILQYSILLNNNGRIERLPLSVKKLPLQKNK